MHGCHREISGQCDGLREGLMQRNRLWPNMKSIYSMLSASPPPDKSSAAGI